MTSTRQITVLSCSLSLTKGMLQKTLLWNLNMMMRYISHHDVYHLRNPNKTKIVFGCAAKHNGVSLNSKWLQGLDLTNSNFWCIPEI